MINRANQRVNAAVFDAEAAQVFERFFLAKIDKFAFDAGTDHERFRSEMILGVILNKIDILRGGLCSIALCNSGEIGLGNVAREQGWLWSQQKESPRDAC